MVNAVHKTLNADWEWDIPDPIVDLAVTVEFVDAIIYMDMSMKMVHAIEKVQ